jgi:ATP-dependent Zn protease
MNQPILDLRRTAIHESGHVVIASVLKLPCPRVTIAVDGDSAGHAVTPDPYYVLGKWWGETPEDIPDRLHGTFKGVMCARILMYMAGSLAEVEILGDCPGGDGDDRYQIACMLDDVYGEARERSEPRLWARAGWMVRHHRHKIEAMAEALMARRTLVAEDIEAIIRAA